MVDYQSYKILTLQILLSHFNKICKFQVGPAVKFSMAENGPKFSPPRLGQHTTEILSTILDYTSDEIADLRFNKVIQ